MSNMFLSAEDVQIMTGLKQPHAQIKVLQDKLKIPAYKNAANQVVVYKGWLDNYADPLEPAVAMPDFAAMDKIE